VASPAWLSFGGVVLRGGFLKSACVDLDRPYPPRAIQHALTLRCNRHSPLELLSFGDVLSSSLVSEPNMPLSHASLGFLGSHLVLLGLSLLLASV
jgi:hypothetical protein